ncbi:HAMP domain-containing histidine kinase [Stenotrophomonas sp. STM01]|uniref:sensor histidine kinase n=1 Tax=Stenotrophomonas sp. STM01 TaxID=2769278 RepID=UPI0017835B30|nr:HAMP domain-containing sensor histidine kinase [Stenotrophomonas sp. STM01]MBD9535423.1 HAMP domain-containing histidine kinase [Stenotrophomonas sp. STM01]
MPYGLSRKIRIAFILQALLVSLAVLVGGYLVTQVIRHGLEEVKLQEEAAHYWQARAKHPGKPPPDTHTLQGYLWLQGQPPDGIPVALRMLSPGFHELKASSQRVLVDPQPAGRLYLVLERSQTERNAFWFGVVPVLLVLIVIYAVSWRTYRVSRRLVWPVNWLARRVSQWDPRRPDAGELAPERLPAEVKGESLQLALALHAMAGRVAAHVARERNFTRDASHELRTPLTVIRMASDMALADPELTPRLQRSLQRIQRAGRDMEAVIDAFLLLAREVDVEPQSEWFDVGDLVRYEAGLAEELLRGKPVELRVSIDGRHPLLAPPRVMHVVVGNLLRNACTYTDVGLVEVTVSHGQLTVRDTGVGMSPDALSRAFEPFVRGEHGNSLGLGLSIVRRLCERCGWQISLDSREGQGTVAVVRFS